MEHGDIKGQASKEQGVTTWLSRGKYKVTEVRVFAWVEFGLGLGDLIRVRVCSRSMVIKVKFLYIYLRFNLKNGFQASLLSSMSLSMANSEFKYLILGFWQWN